MTDIPREKKKRFRPPPMIPATAALVEVYEDFLKVISRTDVERKKVEEKPLDLSNLEGQDTLLKIMIAAHFKAMGYEESGSDENQFPNDLRIQIMTGARSRSAISIISFNNRMVRRMLEVACLEDGRGGNDLVAWVKETLLAKKPLTSYWFKKGKTRIAYIPYEGPVHEREKSTYLGVFKKFAAFFYAELVSHIGEAFSVWKDGQRPNGDFYIGVCPYCRRIYVKTRYDQQYCSYEKTKRWCRQYSTRPDPPTKGKRPRLRQTGPQPPT